MLEPQTLRFLSRLKKNNNKAWFDEHRAQYEAARIDFSNFIQLLIDALQLKDPTITGLTSRDCMFRINRDVRFSNDKSPYKTNFGASIKRGGKKSPFAGYYFHCEPGASFVGGGLWMPAAPELKKLRQEIDYNADQFRSIAENKNFKKTYSGIYEGENAKLSTAPKGYEKDNPVIEYLKFKSYIAITDIKDEALTKASLHKNTLAAFEVLMPMVNFFNQALEG